MSTDQARELIDKIGEVERRLAEIDRRMEPMAEAQAAMQKTINQINFALIGNLHQGGGGLMNEHHFCRAEMGALKSDVGGMKTAIAKLEDFRSRIVYSYLGVAVVGAAAWKVFTHFYKP